MRRNIGSVDLAARFTPNDAEDLRVALGLDVYPDEFDGVKIVVEGPELNEGRVIERVTARDPIDQRR